MFISQSKLSDDNWCSVIKVTEPSHLYDRTITTGREGSDDLETCVSATPAKYSKKLQV